MFRNDTSAGAVFADAFATPGNGVNFQWRTTTGGQCGSAAVSGIVSPVWLKLARSGNVFTAFYAADGVNWTSTGATQTIAMASTALAGLAVAAHNNSYLCLAAFDSLAPAAPAVPAGLAAAPGNAQVVRLQKPLT
jgi:hypothetical protein